MHRGLGEGGGERLKNAFMDSCYEKSYCEMKVDKSWFDDRCMDRLNFYSARSSYREYADAQGWNYHFRDSRTREPVIFGVAFCVSDQIYDPFTDEELVMRKDDFTNLLVALDAIIVLTSIWFINCMNVRIG